MPRILSVSTQNPPYEYHQQDTLVLAKQLFADSFADMDRLLQVFHNGQIEKRYLSVPLDWFTQTHSLKEKNDIYIQFATKLGIECVTSCLAAKEHLKESVACTEIDAIFFISSTGIATPSIDVHIMNQLPFSAHTKRIPIWGLGCAGGASGLSRAYDYCLAYPKSRVLVLCVELCSLTFLHEDKSKSNLIGSSLFADGVGCALLVGDEVELEPYQKKRALPSIRGTQSTLMPNSADVMGWNVVDGGLQVVFSKDIPYIVRNWYKPTIEVFLQGYELSSQHIQHFIAHPGGKKVLEAYQQALNISENKLQYSLEILRHYGNMSSATVLFVLNRFMRAEPNTAEYGLITALGPGFSSELLLVEWQ